MDANFTNLNTDKAELSGASFTGNIDITGTLSSTGNLSTTATFIQKVGSDVASATALTLGTGNIFDITGTTTITSIVTKGIGTSVILQFDGALTLTHHATDLILPSAANITTAAGDIAVFYEYATDDWRCVAYTRADGLALLSPASAGSSLVLLASESASASANIDFDSSVITSTYKKYIIEYFNVVPATDTADLYLTVSDDNGSTFETTGYRYAFQRWLENATTTVISHAGGPNIRLASDMGNAAAESGSGTLTIYEPSHASKRTRFILESNYGSSGNNMVDYRGSGEHETVFALNRFRFAMDTGNITSGEFRLYGVKDS